MTEQDYDLAEFVRDYEFGEASRRILQYRPKRASWDLDQIEVMRQLIKDHVYGALYGPEGKPISIDECEPERVVAAFRNIYDNKEGKRKEFQRRIEEDLGPELGKHVLARAVARDEGDRPSARHHQLSIEKILHRPTMPDDERESRLEYITSIGGL